MKKLEMLFASLLVLALLTLPRAAAAVTFLNSCDENDSGDGLCAETTNRFIVDPLPFCQPYVLAHPSEFGISDWMIQRCSETDQQRQAYDPGPVDQNVPVSYPGVGISMPIPTVR
jgi:hypothetical protein